MLLIELISYQMQCYYSNITWNQKIVSRRKILLPEIWLHFVSCSIIFVKKMKCKNQKYARCTTFEYSLVLSQITILLFPLEVSFYECEVHPASNDIRTTTVTPNLQNVERKRRKKTKKKNKNHNRFETSRIIKYWNDAEMLGSIWTSSLSHKLPYNSQNSRLSNII